MTRLVLTRGEPIDFCVIEVPTEDGRKAVVDFYRHREGCWTVDIADELIVGHPEGLSAVLVLAFRELADRMAAS